MLIQSSNGNRYVNILSLGDLIAIWAKLNQPALAIHVDVLLQP